MTYCLVEILHYSAFLSLQAVVHILQSLPAKGRRKYGRGGLLSLVSPGCLIPDSHLVSNCSLVFIMTTSSCCCKRLVYAAKSGGCSVRSE